MTALIGNKDSEVQMRIAETQMVTEGTLRTRATREQTAAIDRAVIDKIEWAKIDRTEIDRMM
jgi:hypothetical protein